MVEKIVEFVINLNLKMLGFFTIGKLFLNFQIVKWKMNFDHFHLDLTSHFRITNESVFYVFTRSV